ncbi:MAG: glycine-rich domain-containing protein [Solirubrobacterales bacterium]
MDQPSGDGGGTAVLDRPVTDAEVALRRLEDLLDLSNVRMKLADTDEGAGLAIDQIDLMEQEYRKFLALQLLHPGADIVPCEIVDEMWHRHILDTAAYREDCDAIFGQFLDHFPYFGMRGEADAQALNDAYAETLERYEAAFGEPPAETWISSDAARCTRKACKPQKCR